MKTLQITKEEESAIAWALYRLRACYEDSKKALAARPPKLELTAKDNISKYQALDGFYDRLVLRVED